MPKFDTTNLFKKKKNNNNKKKAPPVTSPEKAKNNSNFFQLACFYYIFVIMLCMNMTYFRQADAELTILQVIKSGIDELLRFKVHFCLNAVFIKYLLATTGVLVAIIFYIWNDSVRHARDKNPKGSAKWTTDMKAYNKQYVNPDPFNNIILTQNVRLSMNSFQTKRNCNVLVVGGSGSGKTRFMIKPNILQANCSFVITDPKGEILESEGEMLRKHGYKIKVFNLVDMVHSHSYNPFNYIRDDNGVLMMINCLIKNTNSGKTGGDPFWEKSETALLQALVFYLIKRSGIPDDCKNFNTVMSLLRAAEINEDDPNSESPLDRMFNALEAEDPNSIAVRQYKTFKMGAGKTLKSILISCAVRLTTFNLESIANLTMADDLDLASVGDEKTALFVVIPAADDTYNFLVSMMYSQLFETLYYRAENECPYEYYIKNGTEVLAIARKNPKGDSYTKNDAEKLLIGLKNAVPKKRRVKETGEEQYILKVGKFTKTFISEEQLNEYKNALNSAEIVKGAIRLPYPVRFLLDEFANIGQIPDFTKKLATMRQYEISCTIILQNLAQIKTMYKDDWESIVGNCDSFLFLGGQEYSTLEYISKLLGKTTVTSRSRSISVGKSGGSQSYSNDSKDLLSTDRIATMPKDECICIINGMHPFYGKKFDLTKHPRYIESGDAPGGKKYDNKKYTINYGVRNGGLKAKKDPEPGTEPGIDIVAEKSRPLSELFDNIGGIENFTLNVKPTTAEEKTSDGDKRSIAYGLI